MGLGESPDDDEDVDGVKIGSEDEDYIDIPKIHLKSKCCSTPNLGDYIKH